MASVAGHIAVQPQRSREAALWSALLLPYMAVGIGWVAVGNAWVAIGLYHLGILALAGKSLGPRLRSLLVGNAPRLTLAVVFLVLLGAGVFLQWFPRLLRADFEPDAWLISYGLRGSGLLVLVFVYGCLHPFLEEVHYQRLRARAPWRAHLSYAAYHGLVLSSCFRGWAVLATIASLVAVSILFLAFERGKGGPRLSLLVHICADLVVAAVALRWGGWF